jgi:hypothetical protein
LYVLVLIGTVGGEVPAEFSESLADEGIGVVARDSVEGDVFFEIAAGEGGQSVGEQGLDHGNFTLTQSLAGLRPRIYRAL